MLPFGAAQTTTSNATATTKPAEEFERIMPLTAASAGDWVAYRTLDGAQRLTVVHTTQLLADIEVRTLFKGKMIGQPAVRSMRQESDYARDLAESEGRGLGIRACDDSRGGPGLGLPAERRAVEGRPDIVRAANLDEPGDTDIRRGADGTRSRWQNHRSDGADRSWPRYGDLAAELMRMTQKRLFVGTVAALVYCGAANHRSRPRSHRRTEFTATRFCCVVRPAIARPKRWC